MNKPKTVDFSVMMKNLKLKGAKEVKKEFYVTNLGFQGVLIRSFFFGNRPARVKNKENEKC